MYWLTEQLKSLTASDWAAWVQAIASVVAIIAAAKLSVWQSQKQHREAMRIFAEQRQLERHESTRNLLVISRNCLQVVKASALALSSREKVHAIAEGNIWFDRGGLNAIENAVNAIPLHALPDSLVTPAMRLSGAVRQLRTNVEILLENHRTVDGKKFQEFFSALNNLCGVIDAVNKDIQTAALESGED